LSTPDNLSLYVHWPFCLAKCPYCDFNSHVGEAVDHAAWREALVGEVERWAALTPGRNLTSVFFGGGTPSLMDPQTVANIIARAQSLWTPAPDLEVTLEANPGAAEASRFEAFKDAGVNRLSLGVQSLNDEALRFLGRVHDGAQARAAIVATKRIFPRVNLDFIYARPGQSAPAWREELREALALGVEHYSFYQLSFEPGTVFGTRHRAGSLAAVDEDTALALFTLTQEETERAGRPAYEISNHAAPGAECRHNRDIWRGGDYVGIGPGAHGRVTLGHISHALMQHRSPATWLAAADKTAQDEELTPEERWEERILLGLRTREGIGPSDAAGLEQSIVAELVTEGFAKMHTNGLRLTPKGVPLLDAILGRLLATG